MTTPPDKDVLFPLPPGFVANDQREFCPECAEIWGVLAWYPAIKEGLDLRYVGLAQPRQEICAFLGEGSWNAPTLICGAQSTQPAGVRFQTRNGFSYLDTAREMAVYFAALYGTPRPRGYASTK